MSGRPMELSPGKSSWSSKSEKGSRMSDHPTTCHNCRVATAISLGKYQKTPWERIPCSSCAFRDTDEYGRDVPNRKGQVFVTLDKFDGLEASVAMANRDFETEEHTPGVSFIFENKGLNSKERNSCVNALVGVLRVLTELDPVSRNIVMHVLAGKGPLHEAASLEGISVQAAHARLVKAGQRYQELAKLRLVRARKKKAAK